MIRIVIENILLLLLPTAIYVSYVLLRRGNKAGPANVLDDAPLLWLFVAGVTLVIVTLFLFASPPGGKPGDVYVPPSFKDGKIEPAKILRKGKKPEPSQKQAQ